MKFIGVFSVFLLLCALFSCGRNAGAKNDDVDTSLIANHSVADHIETGKIINPVICQDNPQQSYALYIPNNAGNLPLPIIYFFDPHGNGALPLKKYKALADSFHFILAGSNNSKNGNDWNDAENIWDVLSNDVQHRNAINKNRIYTCGFSGGAKVATYLALQHPEIKGVIANGAGLPDILNAGNVGFSFTAITGRGDLNMTDLISINNGLNKTMMSHRILFFDGIHEWAPVGTMRAAFEGLQTDAMRLQLIPRDEAFIEQIISENKQNVQRNMASHHLVAADQLCNFSISILAGLSDQSDWFRTIKNSLANNPAFQKQWLAEQKILSEEEDIKATYQQQFRNNDINYWTKTINNVKSRARAKTPEGAMYQRLQAYLSLAFYSISNQLINGNKNKDAHFFVTLYKLVDSENSEAWYFSAILHARDNEPQAAENDLQRAVSFGFNDRKRLETQPEINTPPMQKGLAEIIKKINQ